MKKILIGFILIMSLFMTSCFLFQQEGISNTNEQTTYKDVYFAMLQKNTFDTMDCSNVPALVTKEFFTNSSEKTLSAFVSEFKRQQERGLRIKLPDFSILSANEPCYIEMQCEHDKIEDCFKNVVNKDLPTDEKQSIATYILQNDIPGNMQFLNTLLGKKEYCEMMRTIKPSESIPTSFLKECVDTYHINELKDVIVERMQKEESMRDFSEIKEFCGQSGICNCDSDDAYAVYTGEDNCNMNSYDEKNLSIEQYADDMLFKQEKLANIDNSNDKDQYLALINTVCPQVASGSCGSGIEGDYCKVLLGQDCENIDYNVLDFDKITCDLASSEQYRQYLFSKFCGQ